MCFIKHCGYTSSNGRVMSVMRGQRKKRNLFNQRVRENTEGSSGLVVFMQPRPRFVYLDNTRFSRDPRERRKRANRSLSLSSLCREMRDAREGTLGRRMRVVRANSDSAASRVTEISTVHLHTKTPHEDLRCRRTAAVGWSTCTSHRTLSFLGPANTGPRYIFFRIIYRST